MLVTILEDLRAGNMSTERVEVLCTSVSTCCKLSRSSMQGRSRGDPGAALCKFIPRVEYILRRQGLTVTWHGNGLLGTALPAGPRQSANVFDGRGVQVDPERMSLAEAAAWTWHAGADDDAARAAARAAAQRRVSTQK